MLRSQSDKLILSPNDEQPRCAQDAREEVVMRTELRPELGWWIDGRIDVSAEPLLRLRQHVDDVLERSVADNEQIDVALRPKLAARRGPEDESDHNPL